MNLGILLRKKRKIAYFLVYLLTLWNVYQFYKLITKNEHDQETFIEYENTILQLQAETEHFWSSLSAKLIALEVPYHLKTRLNLMLHKGSEYNSSLVSHVQYLSQVDGYESWRQGKTNFERKFKPNKAYEITRRQIDMEITEFWYFIYDELKQIKTNFLNNKKAVENIYNEFILRKRYMLHYIRKLPEVDGYNSWRIKESKKLSDLIQARLYFSQNSYNNCFEAKKLVCFTHSICGFGCQIHHLAKILAVSFGTKRVMVIKDKTWINEGFETLILATSENCTTDYDAEREAWPGHFDSHVIEFPLLNEMQPRSTFHPVIVPSDIAERLELLHGDPRVWWIGQLLKYLMRPSKKLIEIIENSKKKISFKNPIVGIHIRRSDKMQMEAKFHGIEEYMNEAEEYYKQLELKQKVYQKRVYIASDQPSVYTDIAKLYPDYEVLGDVVASATAEVNSRYNEEATKGILTDIYYLTHADFLVCTLSSNICRLIYAIKQQYEVDASNKIKSLDDIYWYSDQPGNYAIAVKSHKPESVFELDLKAGDVIDVQGNHWNGYSKGVNNRSKKFGLFPTFTTMKYFERANYPTYNIIDEN